jgi:hypothetical protein
MTVAALSREPADWTEFEAGKPEFPPKDSSSYSSFYA